jgi:lipoic acid synthetase
MRISPFPPWLKKKAFSFAALNQMQMLLSKYKLTTVCTAARCPNLGECFSSGVATVLILGPVCSRTCRFCVVEKGTPQPLDPTEPEKIAAFIKELNLKYVVLTSVSRDDLPDGGSNHFRRVIEKIRTQMKNIKVEVLIPDFKGKRENLIQIVETSPQVIAHNLETVPRLYPKIRPQADYFLSLQILKWIKQKNNLIKTKSGLMLGLGEREEEVKKVMADLLAAGCDFLTLGQYLAPSRAHWPVQEYLPLQKFAYYQKMGKEMGFASVVAGPFVRSSYLAEKNYSLLPL